MSRSVSSRLTLFAQIAGAGATAWFLWVNAIGSRHQTLGHLVATALFYVLIVWAASALLTFYVYLTVSQANPPDALRVSVRSAAPGMWFAPATILLSGISPLSFAVSVLLDREHGTRLDFPLAAPAGEHAAGTFPIISRGD